MSMTHVRNESASETANAQPIDMKLEVVVVPVSDVERSKRFYSALGWRLDADFVAAICLQSRTPASLREH